MIQTQTNAAAKAGDNGEKLYDLSMIEMMCHGNMEKVKRLVNVFIEQMPTAVEEIKLAFNSGNLANIKKIAHRIKPTLSYYAIVQIEKDIKHIEKLALNGVKTEELELKIKNIEDVITRIVEKMKKDFLYQ